MFPDRHKALAGPSRQPDAHDILPPYRDSGPSDTRPGLRESWTTPSPFEAAEDIEIYSREPQRQGEFWSANNAGYAASRGGDPRYRKTHRCMPPDYVIGMLAFREPRRGGSGDRE